MSEDPNPQGTDPNPNPSGTAGNGDPSNQPNDPINYEVKFKESQKEAIRLSKELEGYKNPPKPKEELPEDEKKVRDVISRYEQERIEQTRKDDEQLKSDLDNLHAIHGDFDNKKLLSIAERYGVYDDNGNVLWERAYELYERLGGVVEYQSKKKPEGGRTTDKLPEADRIPDIGKKTMHDIVAEGLRKFGIGG